MQNQHAHKNLFRVCEAQNHRCACCHGAFPDRLLDYPKYHISIVRLINDGKVRDYCNSVAVCSRCMGMRGAKGTLWKVAQYHEQSGQRAPRECHKDNFVIFSQLVIKAEVPELILMNSGQKMRRNIEQAEPSLVPKITHGIIKKHLWNKANPKTIAYRYTKGNTNKRKRTFKRLYAEQNGYCIYDNHPMISSPDLIKRNDARSATFEHLVRKCDGGSDLIENLALACKVCNNLRGKLHMGVEEFREWAMAQPCEIEYIAANGYHAWSSTIDRDDIPQKIKEIVRRVGLTS